MLTGPNARFRVADRAAYDARREAPATSASDGVDRPRFWLFVRALWLIAFIAATTRIALGTCGPNGPTQEAPTSQAGVWES